VNRPRLKTKVCLLLGLAAISAAPPSACASSSDEMMAVSSRTSGDYLRGRLADGSFQPESYAFGEGGRWAAAESDATVDRLKFIDVARAIASPLEYQHYVPTNDPKTTKLLILVYWGRTGTPARSNDSLALQEVQDAAAVAADTKSANAQAMRGAEIILHPGGQMPCGRFDPDTNVLLLGDQISADNAMASAMGVAAAATRSRDLANARDAAMLGYDLQWGSTDALKGTPLEHRREDLRKELDEGRYFVVLMAYDFQLMWKQKKHKLLWETRVSIRQRKHGFETELLAMAQTASRYFGQDSHGLVRKDLPEGHVDIGEVKLVGTELEK
jgi:hypothetical protein